MRRLNCALLATVAVVGFTSIASAADLPTKAPVYKAPAAAPVSNWTGFYVGLNAGYAWGNSDPTLIGSVTAPPFSLISTTQDPPGLSPRGFIGGGQAGYNWQSGMWVFGGEVDFSGLDAKADATVSPFFTGKGSNNTVTWSSQYDWLFTARLRGGVTVAQNWLLYMTGGLAVTHVHDSVVCSRPTGGNCINVPGNSLTWSDTSTLTGGTIGGGIETMLSPNWSARIEYLYAKFKDTTPNFVPLPIATPPITPLFSFNHDLNIVRFAVNYKFGP
jgi:outer membrane immunogenic protein